ARSRGALIARPWGVAEGAPTRAGALQTRNGEQGRAASKKRGKTGGRDNTHYSRPARDEGHARGVVADIGGSAARRKSTAGELGDHRRLAIAREPEIEAQAPVVGDKRAHEADERGAEKAVRCAKTNERDRIGPGGDMGRDDV